VRKLAFLKRICELKPDNEYHLICRRGFYNSLKRQTGMVAIMSGTLKMILSFTQRDQSRTATAIERTLIIKPTDTIRFHASHLRHGDLEGLPGIGNPGGEKQGKFTASAQCYFGNGDTQGVGGRD
jgi:hypothetical protein